MNAEQSIIIKHALGLNYSKTGRSYRNRYVVGPGSDGYESCTSLVDQKLMTDNGPVEWMAGMHVFRVTELGASAVSAQLPEDE